MKFQTVVPLVALLSSASAHTIFSQLQVEGTLYNTSYAIRTPSYDGPIQDVTTDYIACNGGPNPTSSSANVINVKAGDTVQAVWRHTLTSTEANDQVYVIDPSHKGPVIAYMKKVSDATTAVGAGSGWFKISQSGLNTANAIAQDWAVTDLIANKGYQSITIPSCIANGQYLLRAEIIALHSAGSSGGAQFYINVSGGTGASTPSTVSLPGAYSASDPGILINIYQTLSSYIIPGPAPFVCGGSSSPAPTTSAVATTAKTTSKATSTTLATSTKSSSSTAATATGAVAPIYGQCGGTGWTGATACAAGSTCKSTSTYYSKWFFFSILGV
ncbi:hypothetical protein CJF30_00005015 [Rutstroemia sp. NJR-2017a BBW]|nr:hypothetical protein CJF30_00005015 [Rutstroemia sp. NJR-2017a BBW]